MSDKRFLLEESFAIDGSRSRITRNETQSGYWYGGDVVTEFGIVSIYGEAGHSRFDFAWKGRHYLRHENRGRTPRGLAIEATKFARRIANAR